QGGSQGPAQASRQEPRHHQPSRDLPFQRGGPECRLKNPPEWNLKDLSRQTGDQGHQESNQEEAALVALSQNCAALEGPARPEVFEQQGRNRHAIAQDKPDRQRNSQNKKRDEKFWKEVPERMQYTQCQKWAQDPKQGHHEEFHKPPNTPSHTSVRAANRGVLAEIEPGQGKGRGAQGYRVRETVGDC